MKDYILKHHEAFVVITEIFQVITMIVFLITMFIWPWYYYVIPLITSIISWFLRIFYAHLLVESLLETIKRAQNPAVVLEGLILTGQQKRRILRKVERDPVLKQKISGVFKEI